MVAAITWLVNSYIVYNTIPTLGIGYSCLAETAARLEGYGAVGCVESHPRAVGEVALELWILERLARDWVVIVIGPVSVLRAVETVLPYTVRAIAYPFL